MSDLKCPEDGRPMVKRTGKYGDFLACERWPICDVTHNLHPDGTPMGHPANRSVRRARIAAHRELDRFQEVKGVTKKDSYLWLQEVMGVHKEDAHIGRFNYNQCHALMALIRDAIGDAPSR